MSTPPAGVNDLLIVEDEAVIGMLLEDEGRRAGYRVLPIAVDVHDALARLEQATPGAAIVDMNLAGTSALPVADMLAARNVPFVFISGREVVAPPRHRDVPCIAKPFAVSDVMAALAAVCCKAVR